MSSQAERKVKMYKGVGFLVIEGNSGKKGLPLSVLHCWKYFSPRSNFETKNPKLGSDNPFVLSVNFKNHLDLVCQFLD